MREMGDATSNVTPNESEGSGGEAHSREEAMLRELWDATREESPPPPPPIPYPLRAQRSDSSLAEKIKFLAEASWTSDVDFVDLPEQAAADLANGMHCLQDPEVLECNPGLSSAQASATVGWTPSEQTMLPSEQSMLDGSESGNGADLFTGLPLSRMPRDHGSVTLPLTPPLFTSAAPSTNTSTGIPSKLFDFIAPHLPTDTDLSSLITEDAYPAQPQGLTHLGMSGEAAAGVPNSSQLTGSGSLSDFGVVNRLTVGRQEAMGVPMPNNIVQDSLPVNQRQLTSETQNVRMSMGMPRTTDHLMLPQYQMPVSGHNQTVASQATPFSQAISASPEPVHGHTVSYEHPQQVHPLEPSFGSQAQSEVWGSEHERISARQDYSRGGSGNIEKMVQNCLKPALGCDTKLEVVSFNNSGSTHHSDYGFAQEDKSWSQSPSHTAGYLPSSGSWSPQSSGVQLEPSLVPASQSRGLQLAHSFPGPIPGTVISKSVKQFPIQSSPSPEPHPHHHHHKVWAAGMNVMDRVDVESTMSSGSTGTSISSGHRVHRGSKSLEDVTDGTVICPKKIVRKNMEGEGCPVGQESPETPHKSRVSSISTGCNEAMAIDSEAPQNNMLVEDYLEILKSAQGSKKALQNMMPPCAPGPLDPALEETIKKCDFNLRVSRAQKKMEEHNECMHRIDQMAACGQLSREEAKSRRRQAYNRREAAASRARKDNELRDIVKEKERLEKVEQHLRELIVCGPTPLKKKTPILRRQNSAGACGSGQSTPFNWKAFTAPKAADIVRLTM